jgi:hypothetical protein
VFELSSNLTVPLIYLFELNNIIDWSWITQLISYSAFTEIFIPKIIGASPAVITL